MVVFSAEASEISGPDDNDDLVHVGPALALWSVLV